MRKNIKNLAAVMLVAGLGLVNNTSAEATEVAVQPSAMISGFNTLNMVKMVNDISRDSPAVESTTVGPKSLTTMHGEVNSFKGLALAADSTTKASIVGADSIEATTSVGTLDSSGSTIGNAAIAATVGTAVSRTTVSSIGAIAAGSIAIGTAVVAAAPTIAIAALGFGTALLSTLF